jgi:hypothetical protein
MGVQRLCSFDPVTADRVRVVAETADGQPVQIKSPALYNEPARENPGMHVSAYFDLGWSFATDVLAKGEDYARSMARCFDLYDTIVCNGAVKPDENGVMIFRDGEEVFTQRLDALRTLIGMRGDKEHEVKLILTVLREEAKETDPILRNHMDTLIRSTADMINKFGFDGADNDYEVPATAAQWKRYDAYMARLDDEMKKTNPDAILSAALFSWGMGMSRETLERIDQIQYMDYCEPHNALAMPTLEGMQRNVARIIQAGADPKKVQIGIGTHGYDRNGYWNTLENANWWDCLYPDNEVHCSPALAGDATAYSLFSGLGGIMVFTVACDRTMDDPLSVACGIENALRRYVNEW